MSSKLKDKVAIVTGAASGIGKAIAEIYAREGARVAIADMNMAAATAAADELKAKGTSAMPLAMDVTDESQVNAGVAAVVEAWGGVDILVSNAGIQIVHPLEEFTYAEWKKMIAIHLDGAFLTTKACLPHMYAKGGGEVHVGDRDLGAFARVDLGDGLADAAGGPGDECDLVLQLAAHGWGVLGGVLMVMVWVARLDGDVMSNTCTPWSWRSRASQRGSSSVVWVSVMPAAQCSSIEARENS